MLSLVTSETGVPVSEDLSLEVIRSGSGPTLLLLHGIEGVRADHALIEHLAASYTVIAPSHPGFGLSPRPDWCDSVEDLAYLYLDFIEQEDLSDITVVGLQFGGWLACEIAIRDDSRLHSVMLIDPVGIKISGREERDIVDVFAIPREELNTRLYAKPDSGPGNLAEADADIVLHLARNEEALALYAWDPFLHNPRLARWLHRISVPTLIVHGESDGIVSSEYCQRFADLIPAATFSSIPDAGHCAQIDQPHTIAALIAASAH